MEHLQQVLEPVTFSGTGIISGSTVPIFNTLNLNGNITGSLKMVSGGTLAGNAASTISGTSTFNGTGITTTGTNITFNAVVLNGNITGSFNVAASGTLTNNLSTTTVSGTVYYAGIGTVSGSTISFNNVTIAGAVDFGSALSTITGTLQINSGGSVANSHAVAYSGSNATLEYYEGGGSGSKINTTVYEWPNTGAVNIYIDNNTWIQIASGKSITGNLTVHYGALQSTGANTLTMSGTTQTITISNASGGAIYGTDNGSGNNLTLAIANGSTTTLTGRCYYKQ